MTPLHLLTFSTLFPHAARPNQGIFVENRLRHLVDSGQATSLVLAPVPWFPSGSSMFGDWALHAAAPAVETRHGLTIRHPALSGHSQNRDAARAVAAVPDHGAPGG